MSIVYYCFYTLQIVNHIHLLFQSLVLATSPLGCRVLLAGWLLLSTGTCQLVSSWHCNYCHRLDRLIGCLLERMTFKWKSGFSVISIAESRYIEFTTRSSHSSALGIRVGMTSQSSEVSFGDLKAPLLGFWKNILFVQWSTGTLPERPWGSRPGLYQLFVCFWISLGITFGIFWKLICDLGCPNASGLRTDSL